MSRLIATTSQTFGPYFHIGMNWLVNDQIAPPGMAGERVTVRGRVTDGDGKPVNDACIEIWQANPEGRYAHSEDAQNKPLTSGFRGWSRVATDGDGLFSFTTVKPGQVPGTDGRLQAPHLVVTIGMRGLLRHLMTRIYFPGEPANAGDTVLGLIDPERRPTLIARKTGDGSLEWNVVLQGDGETVFFDL